MAPPYGPQDQPDPKDVSRICPHCRSVCLLVDTQDRGIIELDTSHRAYRLTEAYGTTGLPIAKQTKWPDPSYSPHDCRDRPWFLIGGLIP